MGVTTAPSASTAPYAPTASTASTASTTSTTPTSTSTNDTDMPSYDFSSTWIGARIDPAYLLGHVCGCISSIFDNNGFDLQIFIAIWINWFEFLIPSRKSLNLSDAGTYKSSESDQTRLES